MTHSSPAPLRLGRSIALALLLALTSPGCGEVGDTPQLETAHLALTECETDDQCPPTSPCKVGKCLAGECRYSLTEPYCCTADEQCQPVDHCSLGSCALTEGDESGQCVYTADPAKPDCCSFSFECDLPPAGYVTKCTAVEELGY